MKPIFYLSILLSSLLLTSCYRKFDLEEYRTTPKMVINSAFSPDTVVMASISRTWFHSESKPDVTIRNAKVELYIDGIFKEEMPWKEYSYWKSSRWLGEDRGGNRYALYIEYGSTARTNRKDCSFHPGIWNSLGGR